MSDQRKDTDKLNSGVCKIYLLPCMFTAGNLFFGFLAVIRCIQASHGADTGVSSDLYFTQAIWFILLACVCDFFDGFAARLTGKESLFGRDFDSIADVVSFGMAPSLLVFLLILSPTEGYPFFRQLGWLIGFIYLLCAAVRLARFNVITHPLLPKEDQLKGTKDFLGIPITAAAGTIASVALLLIDFNLNKWSIVLPPLMILISWLMVSSIPFPSLKNLNWQTEARAKTLIALVALSATIFLLGQAAFAVIFLGYITYGLLRYGKRKAANKKKCNISMSV